MAHYEIGFDHIVGAKFRIDCMDITVKKSFEESTMNLFDEQRIKHMENKWNTLSRR